MYSRNKLSINYFKICFVNRKSNTFVVLVLHVESTKFTCLLPDFGQILSLELESFT